MFRWILGASATLAVALGAPAIVTIQDVIYKADGTRFEGYAFVEWHSFTAADTSNIGMQSKTVSIVNGVLKVQLVPTTNVPAGAYYLVRYNSAGRVQFTEYWSVPPSTQALRLNDVRVAGPGDIIVPPGGQTTVQITDVQGLSNELAIRPLRGQFYTAGRAATINASGSIDGASGNADDCVHVDGSSGPCGSGGGSTGSANFVDAEAPAGTLDGSNLAFTLAAAPSPASSLQLFRNGLLQAAGTDYALSGSRITFASPAPPQTGDSLVASYRTAASGSQGQLTIPNPQVICSTVGSSTSSAAMTQLAWCLLPSGTLRTGDRIEIRFDYGHTGSQSAFGVKVDWGGTTVLSRELPAGDTSLSGNAQVSVSSSGSVFSVQSWGSSSSQTGSAGSAAEGTAGDVAVRLSGRMISSGTDTLAASGFTVIRYPAH